MDAFQILSQLASTSPFASTTGFSMAQAAGFGSTTVQTLAGSIIVFLWANALYMISTGMIVIILLVIFRALTFYRH